MSPLPLYATPGNPETGLLLLQHRVGAPPQLVLSPNLRLSGLLFTLPLELLQVFIALLTFQEGSGEVRATIPQIAEALHLHPDLAQERLILLTSYTFDGAPIVFESAQGIFSLSRRVGVPMNVAEGSPGSEEASYRAAPKEKVVEFSRRRYGTSKAEAEAMVAEQLGITEREPIPEGREGDAFQGMLTVGVPELEARQLLAEFDIEEIEQQLAWLPERGARNPARFLVAAIRGRYESPEARRGGHS